MIIAAIGTADCAQATEITLGEYHNAVLDYIWQHHDGTPTLEEAIQLEADFAFALDPETPWTDHVARVRLGVNRARSDDLWRAVGTLHGSDLADLLQGMVAILHDHEIQSAPRSEALAALDSRSAQVMTDCWTNLRDPGKLVCAAARDVMLHSAAYWTAGTDGNYHASTDGGLDWGEIVEADVKGAIGGAVGFFVGSVVGTYMSGGAGAPAMGPAVAAGAVAGAGTASFFSYVEQDHTRDVLDAGNGGPVASCYGCFCPPGPITP